MKKLFSTLLTACGLTIVLSAHAVSDQPEASEAPLVVRAVIQYCKPGVPTESSLGLNEHGHLEMVILCVPKEGDKVVGMLCDLFVDRCLVGHTDDISPAYFEDLLLKRRGLGKS